MDHGLVGSTRAWPHPLPMPNRRGTRVNVDEPRCQHHAALGVSAFQLSSLNERQYLQRVLNRVAVDALVVLLKIVNWQGQQLETLLNGYTILQSWLW